MLFKKAPSLPNFGHKSTKIVITLTPGTGDKSCEDEAATGEAQMKLDPSTESHSSLSLD
jgi:hypothetical protein